MKPPLKQVIVLVILTIILIIGAKVYSPKETNPMTTPIPPEASMSANATSITNTESQVVITTKKGDITLELYRADAPKTVTNFVELSKRGYYNGVTFHRVEPGFVIQGGDPEGTGRGGESIYGATFADELNPATESYKTSYKKGVLAMANRGPNTNGSQFFIMLDDNLSLPHNYTIFGRVIAGQDVVDKIAVGDVMEKVTVK